MFTGHTHTQSQSVGNGLGPIEVSALHMCYIEYLVKFFVCGLKEPSVSCINSTHTLILRTNIFANRILTTAQSNLKSNVILIIQTGVGAFLEW